MKHIAKISMSLLIVPFLLMAPPSFAFNKNLGYVEDISDREYFKATLDAINNAEESVVVAMYYIAYDPANKDSKPNRLVQALIDAHQRGCKVKAFLDRTGDVEDVSTVTGRELLKKTKNAEASLALKEAGLEVIGSYDTVLNSKVVIIDEEVVITGSANWSKEGLNENPESNSMVLSHNLAKSVLSRLQNLESQITPQ